MRTKSVHSDVECGEGKRTGRGEGAGRGEGNGDTHEKLSGGLRLPKAREIKCREVVVVRCHFSEGEALAHASECAVGLVEISFESGLLLGARAVDGWAMSW